MKRSLFLVVEGADGVGKSTVLKLLLPKLMETGNFSGSVFFHWKPVIGGLSEGCIPDSSPQDPHGSQPRGVPQSLVYLCYHWLTFLYGYFRFVAPALRRGRLVIADRYAYDILLDPRRFRLNLPKWLLRVFVRTLPEPNVVLALVAEPETIVARKHELSIEEINAYQNQLESGIITNLLLVNADGSPDLVAHDAYTQIITALTNPTR